MTASDEASGTPRTDFDVFADNVRADLARGRLTIHQAAQKYYERARNKERELAAKERELQQARTMHAEAIEEWAKWEGAAKQARGEAQWIPVGERLPAKGEPVALRFDNPLGGDAYRTGMLVGHTNPMWSIPHHEHEVSGKPTHWMPLPAAPKPSPESGEQINADAQVALNGNSETTGLPAPASSAPNAVPDDPVAVCLEELSHCCWWDGGGEGGLVRDVAEESIRALAAHYLHKAPEGYALVPRATLEHWREYWNGNRNDRAMWDALNHILDEVETILADAAMQAGRKHD